MGKKIDLTGQQFGEMVVLRKVSSVGEHESRWLCLCSCGEETEAAQSWLTRKRYPKQDCGHVPKWGTHQESRTKLYRVWKGLQERCYYEKHKSYATYKGREVCDEWINSYEAFRDWALANGYVEGLEIDRKKNSEGYSPDNCHWVTHSQNMRNTDQNVLLTAFGETKTVVEWTEDPRSRVTKPLIMYKRKKRGWSDWDTVAVPPRNEVHY